MFPNVPMYIRRRDSSFPFSSNSTWCLRFSVVIVSSATTSFPASTRRSERIPRNSSGKTSADSLRKDSVKIGGAGIPRRA